MTRTEKADMPRTPPGAFDQFREIEGLVPEDPRLASAAQTSAHLCALARQAAKALPFETEPTEFGRLFGSLASNPEPMSESDICCLSLTEVAAEIAARRLSACEVTEACLDRIDRHGARLDCIAGLDPGGSSPSRSGGRCGSGCGK